MILRIAVLLVLGVTFFVVWSGAVILLFPEWIARGLFMLPLDVLVFVALLYSYERWCREDVLRIGRYSARWLKTGER